MFTAILTHSDGRLTKHSHVFSIKEEASSPLSSYYELVLEISAGLTRMVYHDVVSIQLIPTLSGNSKP